MARIKNLSAVQLLHHLDKVILSSREVRNILSTPLIQQTLPLIDVAITLIDEALKQADKADKLLRKKKKEQKQVRFTEDIWMLWTRSLKFLCIICVKIESSNPVKRIICRFDKI